MGGLEMEWNFNIEECPSGRIEEQTIERKDGNKMTKKTFIPSLIWAASKCGKVTRSYKTQEGRFSMFGESELPVAWMPYEIPQHPNKGA
jgi:hypothetical protein